MSHSKVKNNMIFKRKVGQLSLQEIEPEPEPVVPEPVKEEIPVPVKGTGLNTYSRSKKR